MNIALDFNTILNSLVLGGIIWMVRSQSAQTTSAAVALQRAETTEREMVELRARVAIAEAAIAEVALAVARIQGGNA